MSGIAYIVLFVVIGDWSQWYFPNRVYSQTDQPGKPRVIIKAPLRVGEKVDICCFAPKYRNVHPEVTLVVNPNNDPVIRVPQINDNGTMLCYTITMVYDHFGSNALCLVTYSPNCPSLCEKIDTMAYLKLKVFVLSQPNITGPTTIQVRTTACWDCEVSEVSYENFEKDFYLVWLGWDVVGLSNARYITNVNVRSQKLRTRVRVNIYRVVSRVCLQSPRPGRRRIDCCVRMTFTPPIDYLNDPHLFTVTRAPRPSTVAPSPSIVIPTVTSKGTTKTHRPPVSPTTSNPTSRPTQTVQPDKDSTISDDYTLFMDLPVRTDAASMSLKRPALSSRSNGPLILAISVTGSLMVAVVVTIIVYLSVRMTAKKERAATRKRGTPIETSELTSQSKAHPVIEMKVSVPSKEVASSDVRSIWSTENSSHNASEPGTITDFSESDWSTDISESDVDSQYRI